jgi:quercetin dioxygenase-like cupin family protein
VYIPIYRQPGANTIAVVDGIRASLAPILERIKGIDLDVVMDQSVYVRESIRNLVYEAVLGALLAAILVLVFLGSYRPMLVVLISLPLACLGAFIGLYFTKESLNAMTLGGLALAIGLLIDQSIVVIENTERHLSLGKSALDAARDGSLEVAQPLLIITLTLAVVFFPVVFLTGIDRGPDQRRAELPRRQLPRAERTHRPGGRMARDRISGSSGEGDLRMRTGIAVVIACAAAAAPGHAVDRKLPSLVIAWDEILSRPRPNGRSWQVVESPTATLAQLESHVTSLAAGEAPHPPHRHVVEEVLLLKEGTLEVSIEGVSRRIGPGGFVFLASNDLHGWRNVGDTTAVYFVIQWKPLVP